MVNNTTNPTPTMSHICLYQKKKPVNNSMATMIQ